MKFHFQERDLSASFPSSRKYTITIAADDTTTQKVTIFEDGPIEAACEWRQSFEDLSDVKQFNPAQKFTNARLLLTGDELDKWCDAEDTHRGENAASEPHFHNMMCAFMTTFATPQDTEDL
jgi:hypothetical protein